MADQLVNREERGGGAEVAQDLEFQRHSWRVQRVGWAALALLIGAALLGLLGKGPLCRTTAAVPAGDLRVDYERFGHFHTDAALRIEAVPAPGGDGRLRLWVDREYLEGVQIQHVLPQPDRVETAPDRF